MSTADPRGRFVWHELLSADTAGAGAFYPKVVSWKTQAWEHDASYTLMMGKNGPIGGVMGMPANLSAAPHWIPYVGVDDPHATVAQAKSMGGKVTKDVSSLPNGGSFAVLTDPQGAEFAIYKSATPYNGGGAPGAGDFGWHELSTSDPEAALRFYTKLFNWQAGPRHDMGPEMGLYYLFLHDGQQYGGIFKSQDSPSWLCYVQVEDVGKATNAAKAAGGRVLNGPMEVPGGSWIAQVLDPEGVAFALVETRMAAAAPAPAAKPAAPPKPKTPKPPAAAAPAAAPAAKPTPAPAKPAAAPAAAKPASAPAAAPAPKPAAPKPAAPGAAAKPAARPAVKAKAKAKKKVAKKVAKKATKKAKPAAKKARKAVARKAAGKKRPAAKKKAGKARKHR